MKLRSNRNKKNRFVSASARPHRSRKLRSVRASASGSKYAPIINRDFDYFERDVERYIGKKATTLRKWLKEQDFVLDEMSGPARDSAWESWRLDTEAGNITVVFYFDLIPSGRDNRRLNEGKITKAYVEDNQDVTAIANEESRLFSSTKMRKRKVSASKRTTKRPIMAGVGGGITLVLKDIQFTSVPDSRFYGYSDAYFGYYGDFDPDNVFEPEDGYCKGTIEIKSIGTYYDGGNPGLGDIPVDIKVEGVQPGYGDSAHDVFESGLKEVIYDSEIDGDEVKIGGGWGHTTFNGTFKIDLYAPSFYSTVSLVVTIPDKELVEWLDRFAHGDTGDIYYDICINGDYQGDYYENEQDAIDTAKEYASDPQYADDEITVVIEHYSTDYNGEIMDYYEDNGDVVWSSNDDLYD